MFGVLRHLAFNKTTTFSCLYPSTCQCPDSMLPKLKKFNAQEQDQFRQFAPSTFDTKTILYFIGLSTEYCEFMTTSAGSLYVIIRSVPLGRAGTAREHCGDQGQGGTPGGQVEGPVECTGTKFIGA